MTIKPSRHVLGGVLGGHALFPRSAERSAWVEHVTPSRRAPVRSRVGASTAFLRAEEVVPAVAGDHAVAG